MVSTIELDRLLQEISPHAPSGENDLEYDQAFLDLERELQGTPEAYRGEELVQEAKGPDWSKVRRSAGELLQRSHDLRLAVALARALLHTEGFDGLRDGLRLLCGYVERYWDSVYPQLDPDDDNDPELRMNALYELNDWHAMIATVLKVTLCSSRAAGPVNLRQYRIASGKVGELTVSEEEKRSGLALATIEGVFADCDLDELRVTGERVSGALAQLERLSRLLEEKVGSAGAPDFTRLADVLREIDHLLSDRLARRKPLTSAPSRPPEKEDGPDASPKPFMPQYRQPDESPETRSFEMVESRDDVLRVLEQVCTYYELFEPASPVPLLIKRAMRLVEKNFFEIIEDLTPESLDQLERIFGTRKGDADA